MRQRTLQLDPAVLVAVDADAGDPCREPEDDRMIPAADDQRGIARDLPRLACVETLGNDGVRKPEPFGEHARFREVRWSCRGFPAESVRDEDERRPRRLRKLAELADDGAEYRFTRGADLRVDRDRDDGRARTVEMPNGLRDAVEKERVVALIPDALRRHAQSPRERSRGKVANADETSRGEGLGKQSAFVARESGTDGLSEHDDRFSENAAEVDERPPFIDKVGPRR